MYELEVLQNENKKDKGRKGKHMIMSAMSLKLEMLQ